MTKAARDWDGRVVLPRSVSGHALSRRQPELAERLGIVPDYAAFYAPRHGLTQAQLASIASVTTLDAAAALACTTTVSSGPETEALLHAEGMGHLIADRRDAIAEAAARRLDLGVIFDVLGEGITPVWNGHFPAPLADVLEAYSMKSLRRWDEMILRIAEGTTSWAFVKGVGVSNLVRYDYEIAGLDELFSAAQVKSLIARSREQSLLPAPTAEFIKSPRDQLSYLAKAAKAIGIDAALRLRCPGLEWSLRTGLGLKALTAEDMAFMDGFYSIAHDRRVVAAISGPPGMYGSDRAFLNTGWRYHTIARVTPEEAVEMALAGFTPEQAEGIAQHDVPTAVASGWL